MSKQVKISVSDTVLVRDNIEIKLFRARVKDFVSHLISGWFPSKRNDLSPGGVNKYQLIDRENNIYSKKVIDYNTSRVIKDISQKLDDHKTKTLKFTPELVLKIISGEKTSTWGLFDDKDLKVGDMLLFINKQTGQVFGKATITSLRLKTLRTITDEDWVGHERFASEKEMYKTYRQYYGDKVNEQSEVKILTFEFKKLVPTPSHTSIS